MAIFVQNGVSFSFVDFTSQNSFSQELVCEIIEIRFLNDNSLTVVSVIYGLSDNSIFVCVLRHNLTLQLRNKD